MTTPYAWHTTTTLYGELPAGQLSIAITARLRTDFGPLQKIMKITIQKIPVKSTPWLSRVASMTFGIYLCHFVFVQMGYDLYSRILPEGVPTITRILLNAVSVFALCYALVRILSTTRLTRKLVA